MSSAVLGRGNRSIGERSTSGTPLIGSSTAMTEVCKRCAGDLRPADFGNDRGCAFTDGTFTPDNWNCGTIAALLELPHAPAGYENWYDGSGSILGSDETMQIIPVPEEMDCGEGGWGGWIVLTRYKRRGKTSSAVHVGDFWPPEPLTLALAEAVIAVSS